MTKIITVIDLDLPQVDCMSTEGARDARQASESENDVRRATAKRKHEKIQAYVELAFKKIN